MALFSFPLCVAVWGAGRVVWSRERLADALTERSHMLRRQREATAALAVEIDRARLAGDLEIAARARLREIIQLASTARPGEGRERFARIERLCREVLDEMRGVLGLLRSTDRGARAPRPTLEQLDALLADARAGGCVAALEVEGRHRPLPAGVELAAYRTVQHALIAMGRGVPATVRLRYLPDGLELEVRGPRSPGNVAEAALMAARERVLSLGGTFSADTPAPGRRVLRARLPVVSAGA
jgi:hypothetical protein